MTKGKKAATAAAGALLAAALTVSSVGGPVTQTETDGSFAGAMIQMEEAVDNLVNKSVERGMDIEPPTESYTPGINGVIEGLNGMAPTDGTTRTVKVSKEGTLYRGDRVRVCKEFTAGEQMRFATGNVKIISTAQDPEAGRDTMKSSVEVIAILFTQNGQTKLKIASVGGTISLSNTVVICDEELTAAGMVMAEGKRVYIAYNQDGDGMMTAVERNTSGIYEVKWTDIWMDGGDPENICLAIDPYYGEAAVCCTRLPQGSVLDSEREAVLLDLSLPAGGTGIEGLGAEIVLTAEAQPCLHGIDYSTDAYAKGWGMEYVHYWYNANESETVWCNALFIVYPSDDGYRHGIIQARRYRAVANEAAPQGASQVTGYQKSLIYGSLPCADVARVSLSDDSDSPVGVLMTHGMTILPEAGETGATKSRAVVELYLVGKEDDKPCQALQVWTAPMYSTNISNVSAGEVSDGVFYLSFAKESAIYASIMEVRNDRATMGPIVNVGELGTFSCVKAVNKDRSALIYDTASGDGYIRVLNVGRVVAEAIGDNFDGTVLTGGSAGSYISADMTYWPDA